MDEKNKGGRPALEKGYIRIVTTISLTRDLQIRLRQLGGSRWIRKQIEQASKELTNAK